METEETLTPGPPQTERVFLSETILRLRGIHDHERYSYLGPYYAFVTSKRLLKIRNFFFFSSVSQFLLWEKNLFQSHPYIILP